MRLVEIAGVIVGQLLGNLLRSGCRLEGFRAGLALLLIVLILLLDHYIAYRETCLTSLLLEIDLGAVNWLVLLLFCRCLNPITLAHLQVLLEADFGLLIQTCL